MAGKPKYKNAVLNKRTKAVIESAIELLFEKLKARFLGPNKAKSKTLSFKINKDRTLAALFDSTSRQEGMEPRQEVLDGLLSVASSFVDAAKEKTKAKAINSVESFLRESSAKGIDTDVKTVLGGHLSDVWKTMTNDVAKIVNAEATGTRNLAIYDSISRIGALTGNEDPTTFFVVVKDSVTCEECRRLHLLPDGITPRVWKMSELKGTYHKRGEKNPSIYGLHPWCRCSQTILMPGYGFDGSGRVDYIAPGHDEFKKQRGQ